MLLIHKEVATNDVYRAALQNPQYVKTRMTRAFTGRPARALFIEFVAEFDEIAPAVYPHVHYLTTPLRAAAKKAGDGSVIIVWSGTKDA